MTQQPKADVTMTMKELGNELPTPLRVARETFHMHHIERDDDGDAVAVIYYSRRGRVLRVTV